MNVNRRFQKEIRQLYIQQSQRNLLENDYLIYYDETNTSKLHAIIRAPYDSVYRHKFIRLDLTIPDNYPHSPPDVHFIMMALEYILTCMKMVNVVQLY